MIQFLPLIPVPTFPRLDAIDPRFSSGKWLYNIQQVILQIEAFLNTTTPFVDAPSDGNTYGRKNAAWVTVSGSVTTGNLTETVSAILVITGGTGAVVGSGTTIQVKQASTSQSGFLTNTDWNTFNNKQSTLSLNNLTESTSHILTITGGTGSVVGSGTTIQVQKADSTHDGYLSSTDWNNFNGGGGTFGNLTETTSAVLTITGGTGAVKGTGTTIQVKLASGSQAGYLSSADWTTFNGKANAFSTGNLTETTSHILTITGGTGSQIGSGTTIAVQKADATHDGYLSSADWNTFNTGAGGGTSKGLLIAFSSGTVLP